jgi:hypothetical protein
MRRHLFIFAVALIVGSGVAGAQVLNTAHDLSASSDSDETCVFCHTPHNASIDVPLWNHTLSAVATFDVYSSATIDGGNGDFAGADGATVGSALCMSCHDGVVQYGAIVNQSKIGTVTNTSVMTGTAVIGADMTDDHPVNVLYAGPEMVGSPVAAITLDAAGKIQCFSCHDPHNEGSATTDDYPFLAMSNNGSDLCNACHVK